MTQLTRYETARRALAEATSVDEVKTILDKTAAIAEYARRAKDGELVALATELRMRAERRLGELMADDKAAGKIKHGGPRVSKKPLPDSLDKQGVDKNLANRARKAAAAPEEKFEASIRETAALATAVTEGDKAVVKAARERQQQQKQDRRSAREAELADKITALPDRRFGVILADPEWRFEPWSRGSGMDRAADNHYPTSPLEAIKARPVDRIAADDAVLFLWATAPMLPQALEVMAAWGFAYVSHLIWRKAERAAPGSFRSTGLVLGTGYWFRSGHELLLVGTRGNVPAPAPGDQWPSMFDAPPMRHSEKPEEAHELIEAYFPNIPKIELNARRRRAGWDAWGAESPAEIVEAA